MNYIAIDSCQLEALPDLLLEHIGYKTDGVFVEVGAFDGKNWSNTHNLAAIGWRGLYVEPHPDFYQQCVLNHANHPKVIVENAACGAECGTGKLFLGGSLTTMHEDVIDVYNSMDWAKIAGLSHDRFVGCRVETLDFLLEKHNWPVGFDLLVIDVEGAEVDVLSGFTLERWKPRMAIVETHEKYPDERLSAKAGPIGEFFAGYRKVHADTINTVYVRER